MYNEDEIIIDCSTYFSHIFPFCCLINFDNLIILSMLIRSNYLRLF